MFPGKAEEERGAAPQAFPTHRSLRPSPPSIPSSAQSHIPPVTFTNSLSLSTPHSPSSQKDSLFHTA